jgi:hypothetical protein
MFPLVLALLVASAPAPAVALTFPSPPVQADTRQSSSGLVIGEDVSGHVTVYDKSQRVVFEGDKESGRPVRIGVAPGSYDVRLESRREALRITVEVRAGEFAVVDRDRFAVPAGERAGSVRTGNEAKPPARTEPLGDAVNRFEVRFGVYPTPSFSHAEAVPDVHNSWADFGLGVEYLRYLRPDLAVGVAGFARTRTESTWTDRDHDDEIDHDRDSTRTSNTTTFVSAVVRWNFLRRATAWHTIDPYVSGSIGPVFRTNRKTVELYEDRDTWSEGNTGFGGRFGLGADAHLGSVVTLGVVGAWNWSTCPDEDIGYGPKDRGGEVAISMGFEWGRWAHSKR